MRYWGTCLCEQPLSPPPPPSLSFSCALHLNPLPRSSRLSPLAPPVSLTTPFYDYHGIRRRIEKKSSFFIFFFERDIAHYFRFVFILSVFHWRRRRRKRRLKGEQLGQRVLSALQQTCPHKPKERMGICSKMQVSAVRRIKENKTSTKGATATDKQRRKEGGEPGWTRME